MKSFTTLLAAGLYLLSGAQAQVNPYGDPLSYGGSPEIMPSPVGTGNGGGSRWASAFAQAQAIVAQMTNEEKNNITYGHATTENGCSGVSGSVPRLNFPGLCLQDAGNGVRGTDGVNAYSSGIHVGATWNRDLAYTRALWMGREFKAKGVNAALGPVVGPLGRLAEGGRNWEGFSNDPYLCGQLVSETVTGLQQSVIATTKHFIGNEQETRRTASGNLSAVSVQMDDKTMHELYLWPFQDAVKAGTASVMCSYNRLNNSYASQNSKALNGLLKTELGFQGYIVSDWFAQHAGLASADAGLDVAMPNSPGLWDNGTLVAAVANGTLTQSRLDDMATRQLAAYFFSGSNLDDFPALGSGMPANLLAPHKYVNAKNPGSKASLLQAAEEGHVLVKNVNNALPFKTPQLISLFGYDATAPPKRNPDGSGLGDFALGGDSITFINGSWFNVFVFGQGLLPEAAYNGTIISGGGSGASSPSYISDPYSAFQQAAIMKNFEIYWDFHSQAPTVDAASDACVVFINAFATEGLDRPGLEDDYSNTLVNNVASQCSNTIVVIHNAGIRTVDAFYSNPNVTAIVYAHLPGQDSGRALVNLVFADDNKSFSGRMPYTVAKTPSDYGSLLSPSQPGAPDTLDYFFPQSNFTEGVEIDYRAFIAKNIEPRFAFGYGLTYSTFSYSGLTTQTMRNMSLTYLPPDRTNGTITQGGLPSLWQNIATVSFSVTNTGGVTAKEVPQVYIGIPNAVKMQLRGFDKINLRANQTQKVSVKLTRRDLSSWSVVDQQWVLQKGTYNVYVGKSVLDVQLTGSIVI